MNFFFFDDDNYGGDRGGGRGGGVIDADDNALPREEEDASGKGRKHNDVYSIRMKLIATNESVLTVDVSPATFEAMAKQFTGTETGKAKNI